MAKRKSSTNLQTTALLYIVIGILFIIFKNSILFWMMIGIGALFILSGILEITKKRTVNGVVNLAIGIVIIIFAATIVDVVLRIFGGALALKGFIDLITACKNKKKKVFRIIAALLTIAVGILLVLNLWATLSCFFIAIGAVLIVDGIIALLK